MNISPEYGELESSSSRVARASLTELRQTTLPTIYIYTLFYFFVYTPFPAALVVCIINI